MRQFILGNSLDIVKTIGSTSTLGGVMSTEATKGTIAMYHLADGAVTLSTAANIKTVNQFNILCASGNSNIAPQAIPIYRNNFSYTKSVYDAGTKQVTTFNLTSAQDPGSYGITVAIKGLKFNERNTFSAEYYVKNSATPDKIGTAIKAELEEELKKYNITIDWSGDSTLQFTANDYTAFEVKGTGGYFEIKASTTTPCVPPTNDAAAIADMMMKAAADNGTEYTYQDAYTELYPNLPYNPLKAANTTDTGFTVFTLRFAAPRATKTKDDVVNQIVQIALPTGSGAIATLEGIFKAIAGTDYTSGVADTSGSDTTDNTTT